VEVVVQAGPGVGDQAVAEARTEANKIVDEARREAQRTVEEGRQELAKLKQDQDMSQEKEGRSSA
jgi:vacuolar-type H+-ATPase subunit H